MALKVALATAILFLGYGLFLKITNWPVPFAETDLNAGLIRLQTLSLARGPANLIAGTSISAKLQPALIFRDFPGLPVNMGVDGGSPLFATQKILESQVHPQVLLIETNFILTGPDENTDLLDEISNSLFFKMSSYVPLMRREYRPITYLYSKLKMLKDAGSSGALASGKLDISSTDLRIPPQPGPFLLEEKTMAGKWDKLIHEFKARNATIILVMIPDDEHDRSVEDRFARKLAHRHSLPYINLKNDLSGAPLIYSDGTHLIRESARQLSDLLNRVIKNKVPME